MATEVVCFPLKHPKSERTEPALKKTLSLLTSQDGFERAYWGWQHEDTNVFWVLVDWTSIEAHQNFQMKDNYKPFVDELDEVADVSKIQAFHVHLSPYPAFDVLSSDKSPVTEITTFHFAANYSAEERKQFESALREFVVVLEKDVPTSTGFAGGWAAEKLPIEGSLEDTTTFIACLGWHSVEAHWAFRESQLFKDNKHLVEAAKDLRHARVLHISATKVEKNSHF